MGIPSISILLHEIIKLMYHAKVKDPIFFRIGTCGGIGVEGGTVVISDGAVDGMLRDYYEVVSIRKQYIIIYNKAYNFRSLCLESQSNDQLESIVD